MLGAQSLPAQTATSPFLSSDHWTRAVLLRLDAAGLLPPGSDVARRGIPQDEIARLLGYAATLDSGGVAAAYLQKFREEFRETRDRGMTLADASVLGSYITERDQVLAGIGYDTVWTGAIALDDENEARAFGRLGFASRHLAGAIAADHEKVRELQLVAGVKALGVWAGRRTVGYAVGQSGGLVLDAATLDGGGVFLTRPLKLWVLGPVRFEAQISKADNVLNFNNAEFNIEPWLLTGRFSFEPHPRMRFGINRGIMFGGKGNYPFTFSRLFNNLIGFNTANGENAFANQVGSADGRLRVPGVPVAIYAEWAADDLSGGWWDQPGILVGAELYGLPKRDIAFGLERTEFRRHDPENAIWYENPWFRGGWADDGHALGHPLGGFGLEWRAYSAVGLPAPGVSGELAVYRRRRSSLNLFSPEREGHSTGVAGNVNARLSRAIRLIAVAEIEDGDAWTASRARIGVRVGF